jgi:hypothetical protein
LPANHAGTGGKEFLDEATCHWHEGDACCDRSRLNDRLRGRVPPPRQPHRRPYTGRETMNPDNVAPGQPYWLDIYFKKSITNYQICGWRPDNEYR